VRKSGIPTWHSRAYRGNQNRLVLTYAAVHFLARHLGPGRMHRVHYLGSGWRNEFYGSGHKCLADPAPDRSISLHIIKKKIIYSIDKERYSVFDTQFNIIS